MRTIHNWTTEEEDYESQRAAGRYNPALVLKFRDKEGVHEGIIASGHSDDIYVHREGDQTYVQSINHRLGYVGLQVWRGDKFDDVIFIQNESEVEDILGKGGLDKSPIWITKVLSNWDQ